MTAHAGEPVGAGSSLARYVVIEEVGRGGMGRVLRAYDPKLQREVALKEVRGAALGAAGAERLVHEARAMAKLSHPNVAMVYDVTEIERGRFVLVMEYVAGQTLTAWLREPRGWREVVACFREAGRGLAAAHAAGLLHRDFKPDNVLVGIDGRVRVTDFGLAREVLLESTDDRPTEDSAPASADPGERTVSGAVAGTLPYLAPERLMGGPADAATDQFAFCVSLWEALLGERPFAGRAVVELAFAMTSGPPRPPATAPRIPPWLLATISRGLASDARERWPSMDALIHALSRDPTASRRRWIGAAAAVAVLASGAGGVRAWALAQMERCSKDAAAARLSDAWNEGKREEIRAAILASAAPYAGAAWSRTERDLDTYASEWARMHVAACEATTIRGEQSAAVMDLRMACLHRAKVDLAAVTGVLAEADATAVEHADELTASLRPLERCADVEALQAEVEPPLPEEAATVEEIRAALAATRAALGAGRNEDAEQTLAEARAKLKGVEYRPVHTEVTVLHGVLLDRLGQYERARAELSEGLRLAASQRQWQQMQTAASYLIYVVGSRLDRYEEGLRYRDLATGLAEPGTDAEARAVRSIAVVLDAQGKYAEAEAEHRRALALFEELLGPQHPEVARSHFNLGAVLWGQGKYAEAETENRTALAISEEALGAEHPDVAATRQNLALALYSQGKYEEAEATFRQALAVLEKSLGPEHPDVAQLRQNLGGVLQQSGKLDEAEAEYRRALAARQKVLGPDHASVAASRHDLAMVLKTRGKLDEAVAEYRLSLAALETAHGAEHPIVAQAAFNLASALETQRKLGEAETEYRRALKMMIAAFGSEHPYVASCRTQLAGVLFERGAVDESRELAEAAWARRQGDDVPADDRARTAFTLAQAYWAAGDLADRERAVGLAEQALSGFSEAGDAYQEAITVVTAWLEQHRRPDPR